MRRKKGFTQVVVILVALLGLAALSGCASEVAAETVSTPSGNIELDVVNKLALGTLALEETEHAVTETQAAVLLPLWEMLVGGTLQSSAERAAVAERIEQGMSEGQVAALTGLNLTQEDLRTWMQGQETGAGRGEGRVVGGAIGAVVNLLAQRSGSAVSSEDESGAEPTAAPAAPAAATEAAEATVEPSPTPTEEATVLTAEPTSTPDAAESGEPEPTVEVRATSEVEASPEPEETVVARPTTSVEHAATPAPALAQIEDTDPGPPFAIEISSNTATQDPLVEASQTYKITGIVRNDGDQTYALSALQVTFYDSEGFRGVFERAPGPGPTGGEWIWHGQTEADVAYLLLAPGEACPFSVEITAQDMASFLIHADAMPTGRESAAVELSDVRVSADATGYVRISGKATNVNALKVKNVTVVGTLVDDDGQIVSVGSAYVLEEDIAPGGSVHFDLRVEAEAYASTQLYAQAERDWE
jgi:hypothetical protein